MVKFITKENLVKEEIQMTNDVLKNPLATEKLSKLLPKFAIPAIISLLVGALYNIVDQIFIGQGVGMLGNAATNVAFPLTMISTAIALLMGVGSASNFNLELGRGNPDKAGHVAGTGVVLMGICGVLLCAIVIVFLEPLMHAFGATEKVLPYAMTYTGITAIGIPFLIFSTGASNLVRADGSPVYSMICVAAGAVLNTALDALFILALNMGMAGAALATILGQILSACMIVGYMFRFKTVKLTKTYLRPRGKYIKAIVSLGAAPCFNQIAMMITQITMNNVLTYYGANSVYGSEIPLASVGVITKVNILIMSFTLGVAQGCQPINGFNYGAKNFGRVKKTYKLATIIVTAISTAAFLCFQIFPRQIISVFGTGSEEYFMFAERYFRTYMLLVFLIGFQQMTSVFFTSIGKAKLGIFMSMTRQLIFLLPLLLILPMIAGGIDGVMYAGPIADAAAFIVAFIFVVREFKKMTEEQKLLNQV